MAWYVTMDSRSRGEENETYLSPEVESIPAERARYEALGKNAALQIRQRYYDSGKNLYDLSQMITNPYHPYFEPYPLPCLMEGWRWPKFDEPLRNKLKYECGNGLVDIIGTTFETFAISEKVIELIEGIEPGIHQYLPFELICRDGSVHPDKRWLLNVSARAETLDYEHSNVIPMRDHPHWIVDRTNEHRLVVRREAVDGRAMWYEYRYRKLGSGSPFMLSDEFWSAINAAGCAGWRPQGGGFGQHILEL